MNSLLSSPSRRKSQCNQVSHCQSEECLVFTNQKFIEVSPDVASVKRSPLPLDSRTRRSTRLSLRNVSEFKRRGLERFVMRVSCWSRDGRNFRQELKETGDTSLMPELVLETNSLLHRLVNHRQESHLWQRSCQNQRNS